MRRIVFFGFSEGCSGKALATRCLSAHVRKALSFGFVARVFGGPFRPVPSALRLRNCDTRKEIVMVMVAGDMRARGSGSSDQQRVEDGVPSLEEGLCSWTGGSCEHVEESEVGSVAHGWMVESTHGGGQKM